MSPSHFHLRVFLTLIIALFAGTAAVAATLTGVVRNGTSGRPAAGEDVVLIQLSQGMETVASTKTDAQGRFTLDHPAIGQGPVLVRVPYKGVNFHQMVPPGRTVADVDIFEPTADVKSFAVVSRIIIVQPNGPSLIVGEEYTIQNQTSPPVAYFKADGTLEFEIPEGAELGQVSAWGAAGMPVAQGTIDKGKNRYAIAFPFRPGQTGVRLAYQVPYATNQAALSAASFYAVGRVSILVPPTMQFQAPGFQMAGTDEGWNVYTREGVAARTPLSIAVSGTAPPPDLGGGQSAGAEQGSTGAAPAMSQMPARIEKLKWPLVAGFAALFFLGALFLWRRPLVEVAPTNGAAAGRAPVVSKVEEAVNGVHREVHQGLDEIKDALFRLELRRQAGTISEEEYARDRARAEKVLRDFLKG